MISQLFYDRKLVAAAIHRQQFGTRCYVPIETSSIFLRIYCDGWMKYCVAYAIFASADSVKFASNHLPACYFWLHQANVYLPQKLIPTCFSSNMIAGSALQAKCIPVFVVGRF